MSKLGPIAKILGQKGLMPNPKSGTISPDVKKMIEEIKRGKESFKNDDSANVHLAVGKISFDDNKLIENIKTNGNSEKKKIVLDPILVIRKSVKQIKQPATSKNYLSEMREV